ncbi:MAG: DUF262 domain-containing protein [Gammaproteobacteria bacterium]|nr:DUF262 domain-containing protein [Gammaproteobacteria bacterium]
MEIELNEITIRDLVAGYTDDGEGGVRGYGSTLDIRPPYQREFVYKEKQRDAVIETVHKSFPLNVMYWADCDDGRFEVIDGQQRTISICEYVEGNFSIKGMAFHNLQEDARERVLNYPLQVYVCQGTPTEKLDWFKTINIAGAQLTDQELRNALYHGPWLADAKRWFSRSNGPAEQLAGKLINGAANRQAHLETAIEWHKAPDQTIEEYMGAHQHDPTATALWSHFQAVADRAMALFPKYRSEMKGVDWGGLYPKMQDDSLDPAKLEKRVAELMEDDSVTRRKGIYPYLLTGEERHLNIRAFTSAMRRAAYERQKGICPRCPKGASPHELDGMEADHKTPWSEGGKTEAENCQMLCKDCNRRKSNK